MLQDCNWTLNCEEISGDSMLYSRYTVPFAAIVVKCSIAASHSVQSKYLSFQSESYKAHIVHSGLKGRWSKYCKFWWHFYLYSSREALFHFVLVSYLMTLNYQDYIMMVLVEFVWSIGGMNLPGQNCSTETNLQFPHEVTLDWPQAYVIRRRWLATRSIVWR